ncbi:MAG: NADH-quinone oxidoreductase subunit NuoG [Anaerolineales bacterium]|nr:NADH-quinone oxidoreductase subunit NuoG [Anaerolineales bacterium]
MSEPLVTLTIDGKEVSVPAGTLVVDAAKKVGIDIPVFCYHPKMDPVGMCRMCLVEVGMPKRDRQSGEVVTDENGDAIIEFRPKLDTSCTLSVSEGMVVKASSEKAVAGRRDIVEFLLTSHPLDCPVCDKGGECSLQELTMEHGPGKSRFLYENKMHLDKHVPLGDLIYLDQERCIQCARCIRYQELIVDDPVLGFEERGRRLQIVTYSDPEFDSYFSGNTTDICPVGALTTTDFRFGARPWELNAAPSICPHCPVGCNLTLNTRREAGAGGTSVVKRVMPRQNEAVNEIWICDKGRFAHHYASSPDRLTQPLVRKDGELVAATWDEALRTASEGIKAAGQKTLGIAGARAANEDLFVFRRLLEAVGGEAVLHDTMAGGDHVAQFGVGTGTNLKELGQGDAILVIASDLHEEAPIWWQRVFAAAGRGASLVVANARQTRLDKYAAQSIRYAYGDAVQIASGLVAAVSGVNGNSDFAGLETVNSAAKLLSEARNLIVFFGGEGLDYEGTQALANACARLLVETKHVGRPNNGLIAVGSKGNLQGAWDVGLRGDPRGLPAALGAAKAVVLLAADLFGDDPHLADDLDEGVFVVVQELFLTESARRANVVFPARSFIERSGTFTTGERRVQRFYQALQPHGETRPDWRILVDLAERLDFEMGFASELDVFGQIAESVDGYEGLTYEDLSRVDAQWPPVGAQDLYFGGTASKNTHGLGVQIAPGTERGVTFKAGALQQSEIPQSEWVLVPVTELYDHGRTVTESEVLKPRLSAKILRVNRQGVDKIGVEPGQEIELHLNGEVYILPVEIEPSLSDGIVLVARSQGIPASTPAAVELRAVS